MSKLRKLYLLARAVPKTILFNFRYFPPGLAIRFPVIVSHRVGLLRLSGRVLVNKPRFGGIRIGFGDVGIFDQHRSRTIWHVAGTIEFAGDASVGHGSKLSVLGHLRFGHNFTMTAESQIVAHQAVTFGDDCTVSWDVLIMDSDLHRVSDLAGTWINPPKPVTIGNRVWIGCRSVILKGVTLPDGCIVAAGTTVTRSFTEQQVVIGGFPNEILKCGVVWT